MLCSSCKSWFHLVHNCTNKAWRQVNFGNTNNDNNPDTNTHQVDEIMSKPLKLIIDCSVDRYKITPINDKTAEPHMDSCNTMLTRLSWRWTHLRHYEINKPQHEYSHCRSLCIPPNFTLIKELHKDVTFESMVAQHRLCSHEKVPHSVTGVNQWMDYICT